MLLTQICVRQSLMMLYPAVANILIRYSLFKNKDIMVVCKFALIFNKW